MGINAGVEILPFNGGQSWSPVTSSWKNCSIKIHYPEGQNTATHPLNVRDLVFEPNGNVWVVDAHQPPTGDNVYLTTLRLVSDTPSEDIIPDFGLTKRGAVLRPGAANVAPISDKALVSDESFRVAITHLTKMGVGGRKHISGLVIPGRWSRVAKLVTGDSITGSTLLSIHHTRINVVQGMTLLLTFGHNDKVNIIQLTSHPYGTVSSSIRVVATGDTTTFWLDIKDNSTINFEGNKNFTYSLYFDALVGIVEPTNTVIDADVADPSGSVLREITHTNGEILFNGVPILKSTSTVDNLTSNSTTRPLSANQGRVLNSAINAGKILRSTNPVVVSGTQVTLHYVDGTSTVFNTQDTNTDTNTWRGIQDNLTSTSTTESLSANQGRVLKAELDTKASSPGSYSETEVGSYMFARFYVSGFFNLVYNGPHVSGIHLNPSGIQSDDPVHKKYAFLPDEPVTTTLPGTWCIKGDVRTPFNRWRVTLFRRVV